MKKKYALFIFVVLIICAFFVSCRKNQDVSQIQSVEAIKTKVLSWIDIQKSKNPDAIIFIDSLKAGALWDEISISSISSMESMVYVPVKYNSKSTGLVFIVNIKTEELETALLSEITFSVKYPGSNSVKNIAPSEVMKGFYKYKMNDFSGNIVAYNFSNSFLWEIGYENGSNTYRKKILNLAEGQLSEQLKLKTESVSAKQKKLNGNCTAFYLVTYWNDGTRDYQLLGVICNNGGAGGTCELTRVINKDTTLRMKTNCNNNNSGGSSGSSISDVFNNIKDPCIKKIIDQIMTSNMSNDITDILNNVFSINNKINLTFEEDPTLNRDGTPIGGRTTGPAAFGSDGSLNLTILLNPVYLAGTAQEYKAATIIHEIVHASLTYSNAGPNQAQDLYDQYFQHSDMLRSYMEGMSSSLMDFFGMTKLKAMSLCLSGLGQKVTDSEEFTEVITRYGFNRNMTSTDNWSFYNLQYKAAEMLGTTCSGVVGPGNRHE